jgi:hypothetical protein
MKKRNLLISAFAIVFVGTNAFGDARDQAKRLHDRLTGIPPTEAILDQMEQLILQNNAKGAAALATNVTANPVGGKAFYNLSLVRWSAPMTNKDETPRVRFDDFQATIVGLVRDGRSFKEALTANVVYAGPTPTVVTNGVAAYAANNNTHYENLEGRDYHALLQSTPQTTLVPTVTDTAGLLTTRSWAASYYSGGTNRRSTRFAFKNFLCKDMENVTDASRPDDKVRRDVDRAPGGNRDDYLTTCKGCHAGMDGLSNAWAFVDFPAATNQLTQSATVVGKMNINNTVYPNGAVVNSAGWVNYWTVGNNATQLKWRGNTFMNGVGIRSLGQALADTGAFSDCMAKRTFEYVCARPAVSSDNTTLAQLAQSFEAKNYNLKELFEDSAVRCLGN